MKSVKMFGKSVPLLAIVIVSMLAIGTSAVLLDYYGTIGGTVTVKQAVLVDGEGVGTPIVEVFGDVTGGDTVCLWHTLENMATIPAPVSFDTAGLEDGITVKYRTEYCVGYVYNPTAGGVKNEVVEIESADDGTHVTWTIDFPGEAPYVETEGDGSMVVGLIIAPGFEGAEPMFQIHNNDGTDSSFEWGTWLMSPWDPTIEGNWNGWVSGFVNTPVSELDWITCTGGRYNSENPDGIFTISIDRSVLESCEFVGFHWALNLAIGSGFWSDYLVYEQMSCPAGDPGPSWNWATPYVSYSPQNYVGRALFREISVQHLEPGELFDFEICYTFPINVAGAYTITTTVYVFD